MTINLHKVRRTIGIVGFLITFIATPILGYQVFELQKQNEQTRARNEAILNALPVAVLMCNEGGDITYANFEASKILGWDVDDLVGRPLADILPPDMESKHTPKQKEFIAKWKKKPGQWMITRSFKDGFTLNREGERIGPLIIRMRGFSFKESSWLGDQVQIQQLATLALANPPPTVVEPLDQKAIEPGS